MSVATEGPRDLENSGHQHNAMMLTFRLPFINSGHYRQQTGTCSCHVAFTQQQNCCFSLMTLFWNCTGSVACRSPQGKSATEQRDTMHAAPSLAPPHRLFPASPQETNSDLKPCSEEEDLFFLPTLPSAERHGAKS